MVERNELSRSILALLDENIASAISNNQVAHMSPLCCLSQLASSSLTQLMVHFAERSCSFYGGCAFNYSEVYDSMIYANSFFCELECSIVPANFMYVMSSDVCVAS